MDIFIATLIFNNLDIYVCIGVLLLLGQSKSTIGLPINMCPIKQSCNKRGSQDRLSDQAPTSIIIVITI